MTTTPVIRMATLEDVAILANFNEQIALETEDLVLNPDKILDGVTAVLNDPTKGLYFVAEVDGKVVGQTMVTFEFSDWRNATIWWVQSVYVAAEYRRQGIFKQLYAYVKAAAIAHDACGVRLYAYHTNTAAHTTYKALGMVSHNIVFEEMFV